MMSFRGKAIEGGVRCSWLAGLANGRLPYPEYNDQRKNEYTLIWVI